MAEWKRTDKWGAAQAGGGSQGFSVECPETGELGHAKPLKIGQELLGHRLSLEAGVAVPPVEVGMVDGKEHAISKSWGPQSMDVTTVQRVSPDFSADGYKQALGQASGILVYHAWVGTRDIKDAHLVVRPGGMQGQYEVAAIDFADAFEFTPDAQPETAPAHTGAAMIVANRNVEAVTAAVARIEAIPRERIEEVVTSIPDSLLPAADKLRISTGLIARQGKLRAACQNAGWL